MKQEQKNSNKQEERTLGWCFGSMFFSFFTVALVVKTLIKADSWIWETIIGASLSIVGLIIGCTYQLCKSDSFLKDIGIFLLAFIALMDVGLILCILLSTICIDIDTKICTLSIAISYVIGIGVGQMYAAAVSEYKEEKEDNQ